MKRATFHQFRNIKFSASTLRALRWLIGVLVLSMMVWQIAMKSDVTVWWSQLQVAWTSEGKFIWFLLAVALMPLNWFLEIAKWRQLLLQRWNINWSIATKAVLAGVSVSLTTPNRIGEYAGRMLVAPSEQAVTVVITTLLGSVCQWGGFLLFGWPSLIYWLGLRNGWADTTIVFIAILVPALLLIAVLLIRSLQILTWLGRWGKNSIWYRWLRLQAGSLRKLNYRQVLAAFVLGIVRFWVYSLQYLFLLWFFNFPLGFWQGLSGVFSIYFIQAGIPLPPGLGVITRSELAMLIWGSEGIDPLGIVSATFSVFVINLVIPALLGTWFIVKKEKTKPNRK